MDANLTKHYLLLGQSDWSACTDVNGELVGESWKPNHPAGNTSGLDYDGVREQLRLQPRLVQFRKPAGNTLYGPADRRGAGRDRFGNWYWIAASRTEILVNSSGSSRTTHFWSACDGAACVKEQLSGSFQDAQTSAPELESYAGLAVTQDHYLVVGLLDPAGILIWDLYAGGPPRRLEWPKQIPFVPFDMAPRPGGGVFILDRENARYWELDRYFHPVGGESVRIRAPKVDTFQPEDRSVLRSTPERLFPQGISLEYASPLDSSDYVAIEAPPDGSVLLMRTDDSLPFSLIVRYANGERQGEPVSLQAMQDHIDPSEASTFTLRGHDMAFVSSLRETASSQSSNCCGGSSYAATSTPDALYVVAREGEQLYVFYLTLENGQLHIEAQSDYIPLRLFEGKGIVAAAGKVYYDFADRWIPAVAQSRPRFVRNAIFYTQILDSKTPQCAWHRVLFDACIPINAKLEVWSTAADEIRHLGLGGWNAEPIPYRRVTSEEPWNYRLAEQGLTTFELLLQRPRGRFCQLQVRLSGDGTTSPRVHAMRVYYPRFSYLNHYLPGVYREDQQSASFLDRFLANFEGLFTSMEDRIALARILLDVRSAPPEMIDWLASWFGVALDPGWDPYRRQLFLSHAMEFFQYRGTVFGLRMALRLALDQCPNASIFDLSSNTNEASGFRFIEKFRARQISPVLLGDNTIVPVTTKPGTQWTPHQGGAALNTLYAAAAGTTTAFPTVAPTDTSALAAWTQCCNTQLGFVPATNAVTALWQDFASRRYRRMSAWNQAYGATLPSFTSITWPATLPPDGAPLRDWFEFHTIVLATRSLAHRFTVLIPVPPGGNPNDVAQQQRRLLAQRVIDLEKPAHTTYDVKNYWNLFLVGTARLGEDTVLGLGSRDPNLLPAFVLGQGFVGEGYLAAGFPQNAANRQILGEGLCSSQKENA